MIIKTGCFNDSRCTCPVCGNTHELYGGKGYDTHAEGEVEGNAGFYRDVAVCRVCGAVSTFTDKD